MELERLLNDCKKQVDSFIDHKLTSIPDPPITPLLESVRYALSGGKRIRAVLVSLAAELAGERRERVLPTAAAVECFHAYSLVHDDLPAMDNAPVRRGLPSVHAKFGEAAAILTGDSLLPLGFEWIGHDQKAFSPDRSVVKVISLFAKTLGTSGLTGGQYLDLFPPQDEIGRDEMRKRKTAALFEASVLSGAILGQMPEPDLKSLSVFGLQLGMAYQWADDLLDWTEDPVAAEKIRENLQVRIDRATSEALRALAPFGERAANLRELGRHLAERTY